MTTLQQLTDAWGRWQASRNGTSLGWTASTNYGDQSDLDNWHQYQMGADLQSMVVNGSSLPTSQSDICNTLFYNNNTDSPQQLTVTDSRHTTDTFTWTMKESLEVGVDVTTTIGLPDAVSVEIKVGMKVGVSSEQTQTTTQDRSWTIDTPIVIPPRSSVKADVIIASHDYNINYTATLFLHNYVAIWYNDQVNGHFLWFTPIAQVLSECIDNAAAIGVNVNGYSLTPGGISMQTTGTFTGSHGLNVSVMATQLPAGAANARSVRSSGATASAGATAPHLLVFAAK